jgi:signal transduction histidine kinase
VTRRLLFSYLTITAIVLLMLELPLAVFYGDRERDRLTANVERDAMVMATIYEDALQENTSVDPRSAVAYAERTGARVVVLDSDGISKVDTETAADRDLSTRPEIATALAGERSIGTRHSDTLGTDLLYVAVPVASGGDVHGAVRLTLDTSEVNERIHRFWFALAAIAVVVLIAATAVGFLLAQWITRPIRRLQATANRFAGGDLTAATPDTGAPPELVDLQTSMNIMAERLDEHIERQRSFVADASHQLRTPLTALRLRLENIGWMSTNATEQAEIERAVDETTRLGVLVGELLQLARSERRDQPVPTAIVELTGDRVDTWTALAEQAGVRLVLDAPDHELPASVVPGGLEQILDNLLDNAIRSAPTGSTVRVTCVEGDHEHRLIVADNGPGLSPEDRTKALERFWQADQTSAGSGLGLSIVRSLAEASGGSITLEANTPSGLVAIVTVPAATADSATPQR